MVLYPDHHPDEDNAQYHGDDEPQRAVTLTAAFSPLPVTTPARQRQRKIAPLAISLLSEEGTYAVQGVKRAHR